MGYVYKKQVSEKIHFMSENGICFTYNLLLILADSHIIGGGSCHRCGIRQRVNGPHINSAESHLYLGSRDMRVSRRLRPGSGRDF